MNSSAGLDLFPHEAVVTLLEILGVEIIDFYKVSNHLPTQKF